MKKNKEIYSYKLEKQKEEYKAPKIKIPLQSNNKIEKENKNKKDINKFILDFD